MSPKTTSAYSQWLEAMARAERGMAAFWHPGETDEPPEAEAPEAERADEDWATKALFDYYNGD
jgi:hypothetical protein